MLGAVVVDGVVAVGDLGPVADLDGEVKTINRTGNGDNNIDAGR